ncbi:uncharacterized protein EI90DRAFT_3033257 [Cantharellus anzutake]|uniref:uncharacterized protein n=1 Tax=Cantharellus anzutake TaxID=1750568 RepID=UPI001904086E|nr:uncharacterized protein EI90DRAFT_3033257 [Cantharellus anzutake]KAF8341252.1 hypothetical protein EI90DRAFT_3033257 [Cantharellus anzutake]
MPRVFAYVFLHSQCWHIVVLTLYTRDAALVALFIVLHYCGRLAHPPRSCEPVHGQSGLHYVVVWSLPHHLYLLNIYLSG